MNARPILGQIPYVERNLIDLDDPVDSETTFVDPDELMSEIETLRRNFVEEDVKFIHLEKEKEVIAMNALIEREAFLRGMEALKEKNRKLEEISSKLHSYIFGDVEELRSQIQDQERLLKEKEGPIISQIHPYKSVEADVIDLTVKNPEKGKEKVVGIKINEPQVPSKNIIMSKLDLELEKVKIEKQDLAKELEKVENEAQAVETGRKIFFS